MILNYIKSDLYRYTGRVSVYLFLKQYFINRAFNYTFWFRLTSITVPVVKDIIKVIHHYKSQSYGIHIPARTSVGFGLHLGHGVGVIIHPTTTIGNNVNLGQFVTIGSNYGKAASIGDCVYIGPQTCIIEDIEIGSDVIIGAGSIINKSIDNNVIVVGNPGKQIGSCDTNQFIKNRWDCVY